VGRSRTLGRGAAALIVLGATIGSIQLVGNVGRRQVAGEVRSAVAGREKQLRELLAAHLAALELKAQNAATNPRLVAALSGRVSQETLRDLFQTESWWQPVRETFSHTYVAPPGAAPVFITGKKDLGIDSAALVQRALNIRATASAVLAADGRPYAVVAAPVTLPSSALTPLLVLTDPIESGFLGKVVERTGAAVLISDGSRALLGAGQSLETTQLRAAIGYENHPDRLAPTAERPAAVASVEVAPRLWVLGYLDVAPLAAKAGAAWAAIRIGVGSLGGLGFLLLLWSLWRATHPHHHQPAAAGEEFSAPATFPGGESSSGGRYVLVNRLGGGGMAEVHLALAVGERGFRRPCVVKRLRPELVANPAAVAQFTDEATLASSLVHANIVPIFDFTRVGSDYLLVEEYIVGRDLGRLVRRATTAGKQLSPGIVAHIGLQACKALDYAHAKRDHDGLPLGIVHRDVSPENIMVTIRGEVQLLDFGVMKMGQTQGGRTEIGELKGNLTYMAPEQARGLDVDARADLFSLGAVLYFCVAGEPLHGALTGYDLLVKAAAGPGEEEEPALSRLPPSLAPIVRKALAPRREDRYPHAVALGEDLAAVATPGAADIAALVMELFGEELNQEQQQLSATSTSLRSAGGPPLSPLQGGLGR
jgi:hypothetical protein